MDKLRRIFESFIIEDDRNSDKVSYCLGENIDKHIKKVRNLKLKDLEND